MTEKKTIKSSGAAKAKPANDEKKGRVEDVKGGYMGNYSKEYSKGKS